MKKKNNEMLIYQNQIKELINRTYKVSYWDKVKDFLSGLFLVILLLMVLFSFIMILYFLIENPISLAIICLTVLLIIMWCSR